MAWGTITIGGNSSVDHNYVGQLHWSTTPNSSNTSTTVKITMKLGKVGVEKTDTWKCSITIGDSTKNYSASFTIGGDDTYYTAYEIGSYEKTISHDSDNPGSCYVACSCTIPSSDDENGCVLSAENEVALGKVSYEYASAVQSYTGTIIGDTCYITWTPYSSAFYYRLFYGVNSVGKSVIIHPNQTSSYTYEFTIPNSFANQLPNTTSGTMDVILHTYADSACTHHVGSDSIKITVTVPSSMIPTIESATITIDNSVNSTINDWGIAVAGYSKIKVEAKAKGSYGSSVNSFTISGGYSTIQSVTPDSSGVGKLSYTGSILTSSGNKTFYVVAKDSRSRNSSKETAGTVYVYEYSNPIISLLTVSRNSKDSTKVIAKVNWTFTSLNDNNTTSAVLKYKKTTNTIWTTYGTIEKNTDVELTTEFDELSSYNIQVTVTDAVGNSVTAETFLSTTEVLLDFRAGGKGLGIGKVCESDAMEVSLDSIFYGTVYINSEEGTLTLEDYIKSIINTA